MCHPVRDEAAAAELSGDDEAAVAELPVRRWGRGDGPRVLLVHGLISSAATWWRIGKSLAERGVLAAAPDLPGHGAAAAIPPAALDGMAARLRAVDAASRPWDLVVGHSLGGALAVAAAAADPGWARALLLLDPVLRAPADRGPLVSELLLELQRSDESALIRENPRWQPRDAREKAAAARVVTPATVRTILTSTLDWDLIDRTPGAANRIVALGADPEVEDPALTLGEGQRLRAAGVDFGVVHGAGHSVQRDDPERVLAEIEAILRRGPA